MKAWGTLYIVFLFLKNNGFWCVLTFCYSGGSKEIKVFEDIIKFKNLTGCSSVMIARSAEKNCSIFKQDGKLELFTVIRDYLRHAIDYDNVAPNTKYCIQNMLQNIQETERGRNFLESTSLQQIWFV